MYYLYYDVPTYAEDSTCKGSTNCTGSGSLGTHSLASPELGVLGSKQFSTDSTNSSFGSSVNFDDFHISSLMSPLKHY